MATTSARSARSGRDFTATMGTFLNRSPAGPDGRDAYQRSWIASALGQLDPLLRDTIVLVVGEDLTHAEAARALGVAESTVSWRMHEARRQLTPRMDVPDVL